MADKKESIVKGSQGNSAVPAELAAQGYGAKINPNPVYYAPESAGPLHVVVLDRALQPSVEKGKPDQMVYKCLVLQPFTNGHTEEGVKGEDCSPGDIIRVSERHQLQVLANYVGKSAAVCIVPKGKIATRKGKQTVWTFDLYGRLLNDSERKAALEHLQGQGPAMPALLPA